MVRNWEDWQKLKASTWMNQDFSSRINFPRGYDVGTRWANNHSGYVPIGFFQLWSHETDQWRGVRVRQYPSEHNKACRTDVQQGLLYDRRDRELLPEVIVAHLESEPCKLGANWSGRTTKRFGPPSTDNSNTKPIS